MVSVTLMGMESPDNRRKADDSYRAPGRPCVGRKNTPPGAHGKEGAMFAWIPLDVWVATVLAAAAGLMAIFGPSAGGFVLIYVFLCAYIIVEIIGNEIAG
jgi:hypothetical protein